MISGWFILTAITLLTGVAIGMIIMMWIYLIKEIIKEPFGQMTPFAILIFIVTLLGIGLVLRSIGL